MDVLEGRLHVPHGLNVGVNTEVIVVIRILDIFTNGIRENNVEVWLAGVLTLGINLPANEVFLRSYGALIGVLPDKEIREFLAGDLGRQVSHSTISEKDGFSG